jgi:hypothetical protein
MEKRRILFTDTDGKITFLIPSETEINDLNIKAKDGTAGISIADSTGNVSLSGMSSEIKVSSVDGTAGISIADSTGNVLSGFK